MNSNTPAYPASLHAAESQLPASRPPVDGNHRFGVCVIGAGYTGLSAALHLAKAGHRVAVVDAGRIGWGASGRNGGQLGYGMTPLQPALMDQYGDERARRLWLLSVEAVEFFHQLCRVHEIDCDFQPGNLACATTARHLDYLLKHADIVEQYGFDTYERLDASAAQQISGSQIYRGAILARRAGHINPLKYALGLARAAKAAGVTLFEDSRALSVDHARPAIVKFAEGAVTADTVILACNGYVGDLNPALARRLLPIDNYQVATEVLDEALAKTLLREGVCAWDTSRSVHYFRLTRDRRMVMGCGVGSPERWPRQLERDCRKHLRYVYPQLSDTPIEFLWRGTLGSNRRSLPDVGQLDTNVYFAQGYTGHGVGLAPLVGYYLAKAIDGTCEEFDFLSQFTHRNVLPSRKLRPAAIWAYRFATNTLDFLRT